MALKKPEWPEPGDLVVCTVESITDYGAYVKLDEYDKTGLLHISEVSSSWVRNIRDYVREGQKVILKVIRVDTEKGHIDLSLRRVTKREKIEKTLSWKRERKAEALLRIVAERAGITFEEALEKVSVVIEKYGLYEGFEKAAKEGAEILIKSGVPENIANIFAEVAKERIRLPSAKVRGIVELKCLRPNGVNVIKEAFLNASKLERLKNVDIKFYVVAAPKYCIEVTASNYKDAETILQKVADKIISHITKAGGHGEFRREKS
ncbi:MAG: translation initiation factor IF-2 subunit alpha [Candidatus Bathyarchaeia archaeon]